MIFLLNNWIGPDHGQIFSKLLGLEELTGLDFHWFLPFLLWAIPLSYCYSYISRFSVKKTERFFAISDDGKREVNWKNSYLLCASGGLLHTIADAIFRHQTYDSTIKILNGFIEPKLGELYNLSTFGVDIGVTHVLFTYFLAIIVVLMLLYLWDNNFKNLFLFFTIYCALVFFITLFFVGSEYDTAVIILSLAFIVLPLMLLFYVDKDVKNNPTNPNDHPRINPEQGIKIVGMFSLLLSLALLALGLYGIIAPSSLANSLDVGEIFILGMGVLLAFIGGVMLVAAIGLFFRINLSRIFIMTTTLIMLILVYPLFIFFYLNQEDVKVMFKTSKNSTPKSVNNGNERAN